jgi:hypothetical protein
VGRFLVEQLSRAVSAIAFSIRRSIEGEGPVKEQHVYQVDCPEHGASYLVKARQTACCASMQWVPSGRVTSRILGGEAGEIVFR